ncbi:MAG: hypothetical protein CL735_04975 [Chloroflexi bacterium]|nr:hypothetical protein [Chloroflexota bacterium]
MRFKMQTLSKTAFAEYITEIALSVYDFHERFNLPAVDSANNKDLGLKILRDRLVLLNEEIGEQAWELNRSRFDEAVVESADVAFIAIGTLCSLGILAKSAAISVKNNNDSKSSSTHHIDSRSGKLIKTKKQS